MPHFFISTNDINGNQIKISDKENYRHIAKSLRARAGEKLMLIDENRIKYETKINLIDSQNIYCEITKKYPSENYLDFDLYLAQSPLRSDAQTTVIEKSAELGVKGIYPIITDNCSVPADIVEKKREKWQKIMLEASKQCERAVVPECFEPCSLQEILQKNFDKILVFGERSDKISLKNYFAKNKINKNDKILVVIGPEGGFSQREFNLFEEKNLPVITLGKLILKAETAVITALGNIVYEYQG